MISASPRTTVWLLLLAGCGGRDVAPVGQPSSSPAIEIDRLPFAHPATEDVRQLFLKLKVHSEADYRALPRRDRYGWDVRWFEVEVMNGGIDQYFYNSAGDHSAECLEALEAIGAKKSQALLQSANKLFPAGKPSPDRDTRIAQLRAICEPAGRDKHLDDLVTVEIEYELYQLLLEYYQNADPQAQ